MAVRATPGTDGQYIAITSIGTTAVGITWALFRSYKFHQNLKQKQNANAAIDIANTTY